MSDVLKKPKVLLSLLAVLLLGGAVWGYTVHARNKKSAVPKEFTADALKSESDPGKAWEKVHQAMDRTDLTDEQKHQIRENAHNVWEARMDQRMDDYFNAPANQKQAILDRHLDEMQARMKDWEKRRAEHDAQRTAAGGAQTADASGAGRNGPPGGPGNQAGGRPGDTGGRGPGRGGPPSREQRKSHSEARNPDQQARRMAYFGAMQQRAQQRGMQMPFGGGGR
jgi:hypothetical protein